ncbi:RHS repeat-associated core domain-containing protein [Snodgrassella sp. CS2]|uniref:RHS repeat-associated core domain-containing protein n=1 Tax=Snodgrassella sp. CS2 TaxID=3418953 RepID=UPI003CFC10AC
MWGKPIQEIEHSQIQQNLRYQGQYLDRETGLHYNTFRYYDPDIGRFTQPDPIGLLGGFNLYQYAPNGLMWVDPWGLICKNPSGYKKGNVDKHGNLSPNANRASGHRNIRSDNFVQSHHSIQDAWAKKHIFSYQRNAAPAILLQSSSGLPHANISKAQRARRSINGGWNTTLKQEFNISYREMVNAGVHEAQAKKALKSSYKYFDNIRNSNANNPFFDL